MLQALIEPLQYSFMQRSLVIAILVGLLCAVVGSYLMVQRLALLGDAISHSVLPGIAIAFMVGANIFIGAFIAGVFSTMAIANQRRCSNGNSFFHILCPWDYPNYSSSKR